MKKSLLVLTTLALGAACGAPEPGQLPLPDQVQDLSDDEKDRLRAFLTIEGVITDEPMQLSDDHRFAELELVIPDAAEVTGAEVKFELFMEDDPDLGAARQPPILLGRALSSIDIKPGQQNAPAPFGDFDGCGVRVDESFPCSVELNQNRNQLSNLDDLAAGFDPFQRESFIDVAPGTLQFASGVQLGEFAQQVILIENTSADEVTLEARLVGAPGVTIEPIEGSEDLLGDGRSIVLGSEIERDGETVSIVPPFAEVFLAVSFAPVNQFLTTGVVFVSSTNQRTGVRSSRAIKVIANADGDLRPVPAGITIPDPDAPAVDPAASLGGFPADQVQAYDPARLASGLQVQAVQQGDNEVSGLPFTGNTIELDFGEGAPAVFPADAAFVLNVPINNRLSLSLAGLESDVDLTLFELDEDDNIVSDRASVKRNSSGGSDEEAIELRNSAGDEKRFLMVLGRIDPEVTDRSAARANAAQQAASIDEPVSFGINAQASATPEFTAPPEPATGPLEGGNRVALRGIGFQSGAKVFFSGRQALDCEFSVETTRDIDGDEVDDEETLFDCTVPPGSLEAGANPATIVVANPSPEEQGDGQAATRKQAYTYEPPAPRLDSVTPDLSSTDGADGIVIRGAFFSARNGPPIVKFGNIRGTVSEFTDSTRLTVTAPAQGAGVVSITVQNRLNALDEIEERLSLPSNSRNFRYVVPVGPAPTVSEVDPASVSVDGGDALSITGTGFVDGATVSIDGVEAAGVVVNGATSISAVSPARDFPGAVDILVINPDGQSGALEGGLSYFIPAPALDSVIPAQGTTSGGTVTVVKGSGFRAGIQVEFLDDAGGSFASPNVNRVSGTTLIVSSPSVNAGGAYDIRITNPDGQTATLAGAFTYITPDQPPPVISTISPSTGTESGGDIITISGVDFRGNPPQILFGVEEVPPPQVTTFSVDGVDDFVTFTTPAGEPGPVIVRLINDDGQADSTFFTYVNDSGPPNINIVSPDEGTAGNTVTITGANFDVDGQGGLAAGATLTVGLLSATIVSATATEIVFAMPNLDGSIAANVDVANVTIEMTNADGQSATSAFRYLRGGATPPPQINAIAPAAAQIGETVTLTGSGFNATSLLVGDVALAAGSLITNTATSISFAVPEVATVPGVVNVRIFNVDGQQDVTTLSVTLGPAPIINAIAPNEVALGGGSVTLTGTGFIAAATVTVGGAPTAATVDATSATFTAPSQANPTTVAVRITNPDGQSDSTSLTYAAPDVTGGAPEVSVVIPDQVHALVPGDELLIVGANFPAFESADIASDAVPGTAVDATILSSTTTTARVRIDSGLSDSLTGGGLYQVTLNFAGGSVTTGFVVEARAPRTFLVELEDDGGFLIGEFFNPDNLSSVNVRNVAEGIDVSVPIVNATEGFISLAGVGQLNTPPGLPLTIELDYTNPIDGSPVNGVVADPDGILPPVGRPAIELNTPGFFLPANTPLGGIQVFFDTNEPLDEPGFGVIQGFRLVDGGGTVFGGGSVQLFEPFQGDLTFQADFDNDQVNDTVPPGSYFVEIFTDVTQSLARTRDDQPIQAGDPGVQNVNPDPVEQGQGFTLQGFFLDTDEVVAEDVNDNRAVFPLHPLGSQQPGQLDVFSNPLPAGDYRVCVFPAGTGAISCDLADPTAFNFSVVPPRACNPGGGEAQADGQQLNGASFAVATTIGTVDDINVCGLTGATGFELRLDGANNPGGTIEIFVGAGAPPGLQLVTAEDFEDACGGSGTCQGPVPIGPFANPISASSAARLLFIDPAGGNSTFEVMAIARDDQNNCVAGFVDFDQDGSDECLDDCGPLDPTIGLNAPEICDDGIDNNCFGGDQVCGLPFDFGASHVTAQTCGATALEPHVSAARGGLALSDSTVYYNGVSAVAQADLELITPNQVGGGADGSTLFSDVSTGALFALANVSGTPFDQDVDSFPWLVETIVPMNASLQPGAPIALDGPVLINDGNGNGIFAGDGEVVVRARPDWYVIDLANGDTERLIRDQQSDLPTPACPGWAVWGVAERAGLDRVVLFPTFAGAVLRFNLTTRVVEEAGFFPGGLGNSCALSVAPAANRWYLHYQSGAPDFPDVGPAAQTVAFCDASICGNAVCDAATGENNNNCPADCNDPGPACGNGVCEPAIEDDVTCLTDCQPTCGDFICDGGTEDPFSCPTDCSNVGNLGNCGDGFCVLDERLNCLEDCKAAAVCGNDVVEAAESCEDGNTSPGDGCDENCNVEPVAEAEPNDNGAVAPGSFDFFAPNAQAFFDLSFAVTGTIDPVGDEDWFLFQNNTGGELVLDMIVTGDPQSALCPGDPEMFVLDSGEAQIHQNDDDPNRPGNLCPAIQGVIVPDGDLIFIGVQDLNDDEAILDPYRLTVVARQSAPPADPCDGPHFISASQDLTPINGCTTINGDVVFDGAFSENASLPNLQTITQGSLRFQGSAPTGLDFPSLSLIEGDLEFDNTSDLLDLAGLDNLNSVQGSVLLTFNNSLDTLTGLDNLSTIGNDLVIDDNSSLSSILALDANPNGLDQDGDVFNAVFINNNPNLAQTEADDLAIRVNRVCNCNGNFNP